MVLDTVVPRSAATADAFAAGQPVVLRDAADPAAQALRQSRHSAGGALSVRSPAHRGRPLLALAIALSLAVAVVTCSKIPSDPAAVFSLAVDSIPSPSVVAGDTLRDTLGVVHPLTGRAYNIQGQVLTNPIVRFIPLSPTLLAIDSLNLALGAAHADSIARVVADAHGLQSLPFTIPVVLRPDSIKHADTDSITTVALSLAASDSNVSSGLTILLKHIPDSVNADSVTRTYLVRYRIIYPAAAAAGTGRPSDTTLFAYLVDANGNPARTDTTDVTGLATRRVMVRLLNTKIAPGTKDSVVVLATAFYRTTPIGRSPLRFVVRYIAPSGPAGTCSLLPAVRRRSTPAHGHTHANK